MSTHVAPPRLIVLVMAWLALALPLSAQLKPKENTKVLLGLNAAAYGLTTGTFHVRLAENTNNVQVFAADYTGGGASGWGASGLNQILIRPGVEYGLNVSSNGNPWGFADVMFDVPAGYTLYLNDQNVRTWRTANFQGTAGDSTLSKIVLRPNDVADLPAGFCSAPSIGDVIWSVGLGRQVNGRSAGALELREQDITDAVFDPTTLIYYPPGGGGVYILPDTSPAMYGGSNDRGFISAPDTLLHIVWARGLGYTMQFFQPGCYVWWGTNDNAWHFSADPNNLQGSLLEPFSVITVMNQGGGVAEIKQTRDGIIKKWRISKSGGNWSIDEADSARVTTATTTAQTATTRSEIVEVKAGTTVATRVRRNYQTFDWGLAEITDEIADPDGLALTTHYEYFATAGPGYGKLKSIERPDGSWEVYRYSSDPVSYGALEAVLRPWQNDGLAAAAATDANCQVTLYTYASDLGYFSETLAGVEERVLGTTTKKTLITTTHPANAPNSRPLRSEVIQTYTSAANYLTTTRLSYHPRADLDFANRPYSQTNPDGTKTSFLRYKAWFGNYGDSNLTNLHTSGSSGENIWWGQYSFNGFSTQVTGSVPVSSWDSQTFETVYLVPYRSTVGLEIYDGEGRVANRVSYVFIGASGGVPTFEFLTMDDFGYYGGIPTIKHKINGFQETTGYIGGFVSGKTGNDGTYIGYGRDALGRAVLESKDAISASGEYLAQGAIQTYRSFDASDRVLTETVTPPLSSTTDPSAVTTTRVYNYAGLMTSESQESTAGNFTSNFTYPNGGRAKSAVLPDGGTKIETRWTDGSPKSTTGTSVVPQFVKRELSPQSGETGYIRTTTYIATDNGPRWTRTTTDFLGHTVREEKPATNSGVFTKTYTYNTVGQLTKTTETGMAPSLTLYNAWQQPYRSGLDLNSDDTLTPASTDRFSETDTIFEKDANAAWWSKTVTTGYAVNGSSTSYTAGTTKTRLNGYANHGLAYIGHDVSALPNGLYVQSETVNIDRFGNQTRKLVAVQRGAGLGNELRLVTETTYAPDSTIPEIKVTRGGLAQKIQSTQNLVSRFYYDVRGRLVKQTDPKNDTSNTPRVGYVANSDRVAWRQDSAGNTTSYAYNSTDGRLFSTTDPLGKIFYQSYNLRGQVTRTWGATTYPVEYSFNGYGEQDTMNTFRGGGTAWTAATWPASPGTADTTTWNYEAATGLLLSKTDAAGKAAVYTYNARGQLATRTWARSVSSTLVTTTYTYDANTAEQIGIGYSDGTPALTYTFNRLGQNASVTDGTGSRAFAYSATTTQLQTETLDASFFGGRVLTRSWDTSGTGTVGRATGFSLSGANATGTDYAVTYGYDTYGRFNQLTAPGSVATTYNYRTDANLIASITDSSGWAETMAYEPNRDLITSITGAFSGASKAAFGYVHDALGRRTSVAESGEIFNRYTNGGLFTKWSYDDRSEVVGAISYFGTNIADTSSPIPTRGLGYAFDNIGNRTTSSVDSRATTYTSNALNQIVTRASPASIDVTGLAPGNATVTVNGSTASRVGTGDFYYTNVAAASTPLWQSLAVSSNLGGSATRYAYLAATPESYTYDLDGNLTDDGRWHYTWDAENRLTSIETSLATSVLNTGVPRQLLSFKYDYLGRRVRKTVANWNGSAYVASVDRKFIYDGWNLIAEHDVLTSGSPAVARYAWGLDLSKTLQDGGGVGGLLAVYEMNVSNGAITATHLPAYDGNGNVHALINRTSGAVTAAYEYDAFGQTLRATGSFADKNPFRFSTKYTDSETGLLYYGRRYYNPTLGRWLGRDPIEEKGGLHLYGFVGNNGVNQWDYLGMEGSMYADGSGEFGFGNGGSMPQATSSGTSMDAADDRMAEMAFNNAVIGVVNITQSDGSVRSVAITNGMANSTAPISTLSTMGTVTSAATGTTSSTGSEISTTGGGLTQNVGTDASTSQISGVAADGTVTLTPVVVSAGVNPDFAAVINSFRNDQGAALRAWSNLDKAPYFAGATVLVMQLPAVVVVAGRLLRRAIPSVSETGPVQGPPTIYTRVSNRPGNQESVTLTYPDGRVVDINTTRVKIDVPRTDPKAKPGQTRPVKFDNPLSNSKGDKRAPTPEEIEIWKNRPPRK